MKRILAIFGSLTSRIVLTAFAAVTAASLLIAGLAWRTLDTEIAASLNEKRSEERRVGKEC